MENNSIVKKETKVKMVEWFDDHFYKVEYEVEVDADKRGIDANVETKVAYIPSVTTKLGAVAKPFLAHWRGDIGNREADLRMMEGADRGSRIHHAYHVLKTGGVVIYQPFQRPNYTREEVDDIYDKHMGNIAVLKSQDEQYSIYKIKRLYEILKPTVIFSEHIVYSLELNDAGQVDDIWFLEKGEYKINGSEPLVIEESGLYINDLKTGKEIDDDAWMQTARYLKLAESMGLGEFKGTLVTHTQAKTRKGIEGLAVYQRQRPQVEQDNADYEHVARIWDRKFGDKKPRCFEFPTLIKLNMEVRNANNAGASEGLVV